MPESKGCGFDPSVGTIPWRRVWQLTPVFLLGESREQRSLGATVHRVGHYWSDLAHDLNGKRVWKRVDTYVCITESFCCTPETNATLLIKCACVLISAQLLSSIWLCDPVDCTPPSPSVHGILQARILEWVTISYSRESSWHSCMPI